MVNCGITMISILIVKKRLPTVDCNVRCGDTGKGCAEKRNKGIIGRIAAFLPVNIKYFLLLSFVYISLGSKQLI